jgi:hypothetical protein
MPYSENDIKTIAMTTNPYEIHWEFINEAEFTPEHLKHFTVRDIRKMFLRRKDPMVPEMAYLSFLQHSLWGVDFNIPRGIEKIKIQLQLPLYEGKGLSWKSIRLNPNKIWATEDSLDRDIYRMIEEGVAYMGETRKPIPPVVVWLIKDDGRYNYVCHDGHHRVKYYAMHHRRVPAILLEYWIDNRDNPLLAQKLKYRQIDTYVKDLEIVQRNF